MNFTILSFAAGPICPSYCFILSSHVAWGAFCLAAAFAVLVTLGRPGPLVLLVAFGAVFAMPAVAAFATPDFVALGRPGPLVIFAELRLVYLLFFVSSTEDVSLPNAFNMVSIRRSSLLRTCFLSL